MSRAYVTDITHYLDVDGELAEMPAPARKLASFLVLLIDATSQVFPVGNYDTPIRCSVEACTGSIRTSLPSLDQGISWRCPDCGHRGDREAVSMRVPSQSRPVAFARGRFRG
jgi:hypothetical protein